MLRSQQHSLFLLGLFLSATLLMSFGCGDKDEITGGGGGGGTTYANRPPMGIGYYPYRSLSTDPTRFDGNYDGRSEIMSIELDGEVPWLLLGVCNDLSDCETVEPELLPLKGKLDAMIASLKASVSAFRGDASHRVYLAVGPLNADREAPSTSFLGEALIPPAGNFADATVRDEYTRYCEWLVSELEPDYFSPAIEYNLYQSVGADFTNLVSLLQEIKTAVQIIDPDLIVGPSLQWEVYDATSKSPVSVAMSTETALTDALFVTAYPNIYLSQDTITADDFGFANAGIAVADTFPVFFAACGTQPHLQVGMLDALIQVANDSICLGIVWQRLEDLDPVADSLFPDYKINIGLYNDDTATAVSPQPGLALWDQIMRTEAFEIRDW